MSWLVNRTSDACQSWFRLFFVWTESLSLSWYSLTNQNNEEIGGEKQKMCRKIS